MKFKIQVLRTSQIKKDYNILKYFALCILLLSSCIKNLKPTNTWRGTILKNNKLIFVENSDSLSVMVGDTVTVFYSNECDNYYISNTTSKACDTATFERNIFSSDTTKFRFEAWNVRLEENIQKK